MPITRTFTFQEVCQVLAALRHWQATFKQCDLPGIRMLFAEHFEDCYPVTMEEIDALCERINCEDPTPAGNTTGDSEILALVEQIARLSKDGEMVDPEDGSEPYEFQLQDGDDAAATLHGLIDQARTILKVKDPA